MKKILIAIIALSFVSISCEKVIELPLNEADQQIVIEGKLYDVPYASSVKLSRSGTVYSDGDLEKISDAIVQVVDGNGTIYNFTEDPAQDGRYIDTSFVTQPNTVYDLKVTIDDVLYTSTSTTRSNVQFDSLDFVPQTGGFGQEEGDTTYFTFFNFTDNGSEDNFYRIIPYVNGKSPNGDYLSNDDLYNGNNFRQPFFAEEMRKGDTLVAVLVSMDEPNYTFFFSLANTTSGGGPFSATPANPVTNIVGGAIGYFGAYMTDSETIIYPQ
jgi:hypothetical protein